MASTMIVNDEFLSNSHFVFISPTRALIAEQIGEGQVIRIADALRQHKTRVMNASSQKSNEILVGVFPFENSKPGVVWHPENPLWLERSSLIEAWESDNRDGGNLKNSPMVRNIIECPSQKTYTETVFKAQEEIGLGRLIKVVLSRSLIIEFDRKLETFSLMQRLASSNPKSYTFHVPVPFEDDDQTPNAMLVGSSPELLVRKIGNKVFANPLAGTRKRSSDRDKDACIAADLRQSTKDLYEHKLVVESVIESIRPYCKLVSAAPTPHLISTPTLWHLSTIVEGELKDSTTSSLELAASLHPTPAVCGAPRQIAQNLIGQLEGMNRDFFSGLVGWCDASGDGEWAVSIRCSVIREKVAKLYAGAGIVAQSDPESELRETSAKLETMLSAFGVPL